MFPDRVAGGGPALGVTSSGSIRSAPALRGSRAGDVGEQVVVKRFDRYWGRARPALQRHRVSAGREIDALPAPGRPASRASVDHGGPRSSPTSNPSSKLHPDLVLHHMASPRHQATWRSNPAARGRSRSRRVRPARSAMRSTRSRSSKASPIQGPREIAARKGRLPPGEWGLSCFRPPRYWLRTRDRHGSCLDEADRRARRSICRRSTSSTRQPTPAPVPRAARAHRAA